MTQTPSLLYLLAFSLLATCIWALRRPNDREPVRVLMMLLTVPALVGYLLILEDDAGLLKFDRHLYLIDRALLGTSPAFFLTRLLSTPVRVALSVIYRATGPMIILWYILARLQRVPGFGVAVTANFILGSLLYLVVPASGPAFAFPDFRVALPNVTPSLMVVTAPPNAIPSLHMSTAILTLLFAGRRATLRVAAGVFVTGTAVATLIGEHYVIDLIVAVPFAFFVARLATKRYAEAFINFAVVLAWLWSIRLATPALIEHPAWLWICAIATLLIPCVWGGLQRKATREIDWPVAAEEAP